MRRYEIDLSIEEVVFCRSALERELDRLCMRWRRTFVEDGKGLADIYIQPIERIRDVIWRINSVSGDVLREGGIK